MDLKKLGKALVCFLVLGAITTGSACATAIETAEPWRIGTSEGGTTFLFGEQTVTATSTSTGILVTEVGETPLKLEFGEISCRECKIFNEGIVSGFAEGEGKLEFRLVKVVTPSGCQVEKITILTKQLRIDADYMEGTSALQLFRPASGLSLATVALEKGLGKTCPISGHYILGGRFFSKAVNLTGVYKASQELQLSPSINSAAGGELNFGSKPAQLTGSVKFEASGLYFGVE